jgi:hypothetical protein
MLYVIVWLLVPYYIFMTIMTILPLLAILYVKWFIVWLFVLAIICLLVKSYFDYLNNCGDSWIEGELRLHNILGNCSIEGELRLLCKCVWHAKMGKLQKLRGSHVNSLKIIKRSIGLSLRQNCYPFANFQKGGELLISGAYQNFLQNFSPLYILVLQIVKKGRLLY